MQEYEDQNPDFYEQIPQFYPEEQKRAKPNTAKWIAIALCFSLIGGAVGVGGTLWMNGRAEDASVTKVTTSNDKKQNKDDKEEHTINKSDRTELEIQEVPAGEEMSPSQIYAKNVNSTVGVTTSITTNYWGYQTTSAASGSGFIITDDGYILTNHHVIEDSTTITVSLYDGATYDAKLVGYDASNDLAVLKINASGLTPVVIGSSETLHVGDTVMAIGNPLGELTFSMTMGIISAKDRQVTLSSGSTMNLLQTDCSINSGNSGGALFNIYGEVVGITNAKYSNNGDAYEASIESIGFAIPIDNAMTIAESIIENGYVSKPYIGVSVTDVSQQTQAYGLPQGASVQDVVEDSPSEQAGLQKNDIITKVNGTVITGSSALVELVGKTKVGDILDMEIYRQGKTITITVTVGEKVQSAIPEEDTQASQLQPYFPQGR